jgi:hypothetical protein
LRDTALPNRREAKLAEEAGAETQSAPHEEWNFNPLPTPLVDPLGLGVAILLIAILMAGVIAVVMI